VLHVPRLADWFDNGISMKFNTALCAAATGLGLALLNMRPASLAGATGLRRTIIRALGGLVVLIGLLTLLQHATGVNLRIDELVVHDVPDAKATAAPGRMGPMASSCFAILAMALVLLCGVVGGKGRRIAGPFGWIVLCISGIPLTGYLFGADFLYTVPRLTGIALQTASMLFAMAVGMIFAAHEFGAAAALAIPPRDSAGALLLRRLFLPVILLPVAVGWLRVIGQGHGLYDTAFGTAVFSFFMAIVLGAIVLSTARKLIAVEQVRRADQAALRDSERRVRAMLEQLPVAVGVMDSAGTWALTNPLMEELVPRAIPSTLPDHIPRWRAWDEQGNTILPENWPGKRALRGEVMAPGLEMLYRTHDGRDVWMRVSAAPLRDEEGRPIGATLVVQDIDEAKHAEGALRQARDAAENASRAKDLFLAALSHELRTPLTPVLMTIAAMDMSPELAPELRENVAMIRRNIELEARLIDDLLDLNRVASGKLRLNLEAVDVNSAVRHVWETCRPFILEKGIHLECDLPEIAPQVKADAARLQQILWNLLNNAAKFTPEHGEIHLRVCHTDCQGAQGGDASRVRVELRDNGIGIAPEMLPKIFDAFEQGDAGITRQFGGMGLGLAISKALVEMHGGTIRAQSNGPGQGSTFTIELPAMLRDQVALPPEQAPSHVGKNGKLRVLVVEDHPDTAKVLARLLSACGHAVKTAQTAAAALELAGAEPFDVLVSDIGLPDATGYELMKEIKSRYGIKGIAMSGYGMEEDLRKGREAGFSDHIVKPANVAQLEHAIRRVAAGAGQNAG
jgi:signal transduction histidine kinase/ActR/RegA family two-component response regulator